MTELSLVSVNIERSRHLDTLIPFLEKRQPEVATFQECMERDIPLLEKTLGAKCFFTPLCKIFGRKNEPDGILGQAILTRHLIVGAQFAYYAGEHDPIPLSQNDTMSEIEKIACAVSAVEVEKEDARITIATTHVTKTENGEVTEIQLQKFSALMAELAKMHDFILTGDFNAPRGRAAWGMVADIYKDNIPVKYVSSIDPMHRAGELPFVIDGLFTTPGYRASDVELHSGVSDHKAVTATITKV